MATAGIEPATFGMLVQRSANYSYAVKLVGVGDILELNLAPSISMCSMMLFCGGVLYSGKYDAMIRLSTTHAKQ